jgi:Zn-dependent M28 family amino/carboxypeptidase
MDNASGLAVLLEAAERLPREPALDGVDLVFLATGAEEIGLAGALRWIARHEAALDRRRTVFLNVDSVGVGRGLLALNVAGRAPDGRPVRDVIRAAAAATGVRLRRLPFLPGVGVDSMPMAARGYATVTLLGEVLGGGSRRIHTANDTLAHLGEAALAAAGELVVGIAREIGGKGS